MSISLKLRFCSQYGRQVALTDWNKDCDCINCANGVICDDSCPQHSITLKLCFECLNQRIR